MRLCNNIKRQKPSGGHEIRFRFAGGWVAEAEEPNLCFSFADPDPMSLQNGVMCSPLENKPHIWRRALPRSAYHNSESGQRLARRASTPQVRPALPMFRASEAMMGTSSSQIQAVPHSDTHKLPR